MPGKNYLTVSEFAQLHNVNKRTLHYYDEIGIFSPQKVGENGYRYYTYLQSAKFEIILALRELGMSIEEIRDYQENRNAQGLSALLLEKTHEVDEKIRQLKYLKTVLTHKRENLLLAQSDHIRSIDVIHCRSEYQLLTPIQGRRSEEELDAAVYSSLARYRDQGKAVRAFNSSYGCMIALEDLEAGRFDRYRTLYVTIPNPASREGLTLKPGGTYLRAYCKGSWDHLPETYLRLWTYARSHKLRFTGPSYEAGINEMGIPSVQDMDLYVTEITIPCEPIP